MKKIILFIKNFILSIFYTDYYFCIKSLFSKKKNINNFNILFIFHDGDLGLKIKSLYFSQIIDSFKIVYYNRLNKAKEIITILKPLSIKKTFFNAKKINLFYYFYNFLRFIFKNDLLIVKFWKKFLINNNIIEVYGIQPDKFLCRACKSLNIKIYDIQHGFIQSSIRLYLSYHYNLDIDINLLPSCFIVFDEISKITLINELNKNNISTDLIKIEVIRNPYYALFNNFEDNYLSLESFITNYEKNIFLLKYLKNYFEESRNLINNLTNNNKIKILVTFQWGEFLENFEKDILKLIKIISSKNYLRDKYQFFLRLHPLELKNFKKIKKLKKRLINYFDFVDFEISSQVPLFLLLKNIDIHISYNSAVYLDCLNYNIKTFFLDNDIKNNLEFKEYINIMEKKYLKIVSFDNIIEILENL